MLFRIHQERGARVARKRGWVLRMLGVLDVDDWSHFFGGLISDDEAATFIRELALGLRNDPIHVGATDGWRSQFHSLCHIRSRARMRWVSIRLVSARSPTRSASSTTLPFISMMSVRPRCSRSWSIVGRWLKV